MVGNVTLATAEATRRGKAMRKEDDPTIMCSNQLVRVY
jgi:hypothetical protein